MKTYQTKEQAIFITGMLRSGTTLLQRLLNLHPLADILYQPFMSFFVDVKNDFLSSMGYSKENYPLGTLFLENRYKPVDFNEYLKKYESSAHPVIEPSDFYQLFNMLLLKTINRNVVNVYGLKEVLCEEYAPFLADHGTKVVFILRDPRDVLTSMNYGRGEKYSGKVRPTLYNLRLWRKSVALAVYLAMQNKALWIRYEDLVTDPYTQIKLVLDYIGLKSISECKWDISIARLDNIVWSGNSSFAEKKGISTGSVGQYQKVLPASLIAYIETVCGPEMSLLNYPLSRSPVDDPVAMLNQFQEPVCPSHASVDPEFSLNANRIQEELNRLWLLKRESLPREAESYFIYSDLWKIFKQSWLSH